MGDKALPDLEHLWFYNTLLLATWIFLWFWRMSRAEWKGSEGGLQNWEEEDLPPLEPIPEMQSPDEDTQFTDPAHGHPEEAPDPLSPSRSEVKVAWSKLQAGLTAAKELLAATQWGYRQEEEDVEEEEGKLLEPEIDNNSAEWGNMARAKTKEAEEQGEASERQNDAFIPSNLIFTPDEYDEWQSDDEIFIPSNLVFREENRHLGDGFGNFYFQYFTWGYLWMTEPADKNFSK